MRRTYCWVCTVLGTAAALSTIALLMAPAKPVYAKQLSPVHCIAQHVQAQAR